jgi:hypothetical protein
LNRPYAIRHYAIRHYARRRVKHARTGLPMMPHRPPYLSPSRLWAYDRCPQVYRDRYILKVDQPASYEREFGTAVHAGLEAHFGGGDGDLAFRREWRERMAELREAGGRLPDLTSTGLDLIDKVVQLGISGTPERKIWIRCEAYLNAPMLGYVDLWSESTNTIFDFKTTIGAWSAARAEREQWQPCIYSWAYFLEVGDLPDFEYIVLNRGTGDLQRFKTQRTHDQICDMLDRARAIVLAVAAEKWECTCRKHGAEAA